MKRYITVPSGNRVTLGLYCQAWRRIRANPNRDYGGWHWCHNRGTEILRAIRAGIHDRINRHIPDFGRGRKWDSDWQWTVIRFAREANTPRVILHWIPPEFRSRFSHRLADPDNYR